MNKKPRVLVAEDESIIALDLKQSLESWGFNVEATFRTGEELLEYAQADDPEILIMDIFLQGQMDGFEAARQVLRHNKIPVVFMTGEAKLEKAADINIGGQNVFLKKPFSKEELKEALKKVYPDGPI